MISGSIWFHVFADEFVCVSFCPGGIAALSRASHVVRGGRLSLHGDVLAPWVAQDEAVEGGFRRLGLQCFFDEDEGDVVDAFELAWEEVGFGVAEFLI